MEDWKDTVKELPETDGWYEISNFPFDAEAKIALAEYDGYGFIYCGVYRYPKFWRRGPVRVKKYGKTDQADNK